MGEKYKSGFGVKGLYQKRGWFYYRPPTRKGFPRSPATALKTTDLVAAVTEVRKMNELADIRVAMNAETVGMALAQYLADKKNDAPATKRARESILARFRDDLGNPKTSGVTSAVVSGWLEKLGGAGGNKRRDAEDGRTDGLSATSVRSYAITVRAFVNWMRVKGMVKGDPMAGVRRSLRVAKTRREDFLTEEQRDRLLAADVLEHARLALHLGFFAGLRESEMLALTPRWLWVADDWSRGTLTVQDTPVKLESGSVWMWRPKTRKMRTIPLHPKLLAFLKVYGLREPFVMAPWKPEWPAPDANSKRFDCKKALQAAAAAAGVEKLTMHMMRHSFATHLAMKGTPLAVIAGLLGDSLRVTEDHYAGYCPSEGNAVMVL